MDKWRGRKRAAIWGFNSSRLGVRIDRERRAAVWGF